MLQYVLAELLVALPTTIGYLDLPALTLSPAIVYGSEVQICITAMPLLSRPQLACGPLFGTLALLLLFPYPGCPRSCLREIKAAGELRG